MNTTKNVIDLTYTQDNFWTQLWPESPAGIKIWNELGCQAELGGNVKLRNWHSTILISQLRAARFKVRKQRIKSSKASNAAADDALLAALNA